MDYILLAEIAALGGYLYWAGNRILREIGKIGGSLAVSGPLSPQVPKPLPLGKEIKIIRLAPDGKYTILARVNENHETVPLALAAPDLAILYPDGKILRTAKDKK